MAHGGGARARGLRAASPRCRRTSIASRPPRRRHGSSSPRRLRPGTRYASCGRRPPKAASRSPRRIRPPDRRPYRRGLRTAVERNRQAVRARSRPTLRQRDRRAQYLDRVTLNWPPMAATECRWSCRIADLRPRGEFCRAIEASGFAAISTAWRGLPRCAATNSSAIRRHPTAFSRHRPAKIGRHR